jgi:16S rRNA (cytidine1402-2'-O)-methyltransferase
MLYVLATPIGNLEDLSSRAKKILSEADFIIAENPSYSLRLLQHLGLKEKILMQFAEHNEEKALPKIIEKLRSQNAALISDAGTPGISDPGFRLIRQAVRENIQVSPIPGPNAAVAALSASGLPTDKFIFLGFVPKTEIKLIKELQKAKDFEATAVFYESPQRILKTVAYIAKAWPNANVVIARELTKIHEEFLRGAARKILEDLKKRPNIKGEIVVILSFK